MSQKINVGKLFDWKTANLGFTIMGLFYIIFPWFSGGAFNQTLAIFGMMFLAVGIVRSKPSVTVLGGLFSAFLGLCYFFVTISFIDPAFLWITSVVFFGAFLVFELGFLKFGPITNEAKAFSIVPLAILSFTLLLALIGKNPTLVIDWTNLWVAANYLAILCFSLFAALELGGWNVMGKATSKWILIFALAAVVTAFIGAYQGTLSVLGVVFF